MHIKGKNMWKYRNSIVHVVEKYILSEKCSLCLSGAGNWSYH